MDKKSKILIWIFVVLTLLSVGYTFYKTVILQDFVVIDSSEEETEEAEMTDDAVEEETGDLENENTEEESVEE